jgi:hypothetical protein
VTQSTVTTAIHKIVTVTATSTTSETVTIS